MDTFSQSEQPKYTMVVYLIIVLSDLALNNLIER